MYLKFWGVRGSVPSGNKETAGIGGNTTCVEVRIGDDLIIIDSGTGIRGLGEELSRTKPLHAKILFTHVHWDHIQGLPFFIPMYSRGNRFDIYGGSTLPVSIRQVLEQQMNPPVFPVRMQELLAELRFFDIRIGDTIEGDNYTISFTNVNHPNGAYAYRFDSNGHSFVFATDVEPFEDKPDPNLVELCRGTDLLIHDAQYSEEEYFGLNGHISRIGWGHSTMPAAVKTAQAARVKNLVLFHHDPAHDDEFIKNVEKESRKLFPGTTAAYEGMEIDFAQSVVPQSIFT